MKKFGLIGLFFALFSVSVFGWSVFESSTNLGITNYTIQCDNGRTINVSQAGERYSSSGFNGSIKSFGSLSSAVSHGCRK